MALKNILGRIGCSALFAVHCLLFTGCFHKDVMSDRADDVTHTFIFTGKGGPLIITHEDIFQASSKESNGGMTTISGHNDCRITSYDLATGAIIGRIDLGAEMDEACEIVGMSEEAIWCYSINADLGLHSRNPRTLEVVTREADLVVGNIQLARPEWSRILDYYNYDYDAGSVMVTDKQGVHYYFNPADKKFTETESDMPDEPWSDDALNSSAYFMKDTFVSFKGSDDRKRIMWRYEDTTASLAFLKPSFFVDLNEQHRKERNNAYMQKIRANAEELQRKFDSVTGEHPVFKDEWPSWDKMTREERDMRGDVERMRRDIQYAERDLEDAERMSDDMNQYALNDQSYSCLVYSAFTVEDTAHALITCVDCTSGKFSERWQLSLDDFYFDPNKAEGAGVFDDGDPEFGYRWAEIYDGKFVMIAQLQMICIDMKTGKQLWQIQL